MSERTNLLIVEGVEGTSVYINNHRVAGPKPWGGGRTVLERSDILVDEVRRALPATSPQGTGTSE
jgi:hypothetical protein